MPRAKKASDVVRMAKRNKGNESRTSGGVMSMIVREDIAEANLLM